MGDTRVIDLAVLAELIGPNPDKLTQFALRFVESTRAGLVELDACLERGDMARIRELGHRIKSSARIVGAFGMAELCERPEHLAPAARAAELAAARALAGQLWPLLEHIGAALAAPGP